MSMPETNRRPVNEPIRVYAPSRGNLAVKSEAAPATRVAEPARRPVRRPAPQTRPLVDPKQAQKRRTLADVWRAYKITPKLFAVLCVGAAAASLLFMMKRYSRISAVQREINELSGRIVEMEKGVERTDIEYMFSIDIGAAHDAARQAGMVYPVAEGIGD